MTSSKGLNGEGSRRQDGASMAESARRLASLDALRGFDMFWILYPTYPTFHTLLVSMGLGGCALDRQMTHPDWVGFTFYDTIFPLFLFIAGVSWTYSAAAQRRRGVSTARMVMRVVRRAATLVFLGWAVSGILQFRLEEVYTWNALTVIGVSWAVAALIYLFAGVRVRVCIWVAWLIGYWMLLLLVPAPGAERGVNPILDPATCLCGWMDTHFLTFRHAPEEGFACIGSVATAMLGMFVGDFLQTERRGRTNARKAAYMAGGAVALLVLGVVASSGLGAWSMPIIKRAWTSSFVLVSGAYSLGMFALFHWIVDVKGHVRWSFPFRVIGMNAVFAYCASRTVFPWRAEMNFLFGGLMGLVPQEWASLVGEVGYVTVYWLLLWVMYRKGLFVKV